MMRRNKPQMPETEAPARLRITHHEGAIVCALEQTVSGKEEAWNRLLQDTISSLARWTDGQGGLVGHIKASLQTPIGTWFYSCTGGDVHVQNLPDRGSQLDFTAILFFVEEAALEAQLEPLLNPTF